MPRPTGLPDPKPMRRALLRWYDAHRRDLPWRRTRDPWAVLVSEVMLQQTTVAAATPYFERFMERWPSPDSLAGASRDELLSAWAGLGYYRRAHMLMDTALGVAEGGQGMPRAAADLRRLPGVGEYTAAAVASIAYDEPVAAVDGNVERVVARLLALHGDPRKAAGRKAVRRAAQALLDVRRPGDFNQAVMELGARVCRPRAPLCEECPLARRCRARAHGDPERFPELPPRTPSVAVVRLAAVVTRRGRVLVEERRASPNAGFLELPGLELAPDQLDGRGAPRAGATDLAAGLGDRLGLELRVDEALPVHRHTITHHRIRVHPYLGTLSSGRVRAPLHWVSKEPARPFTTATRRILSTSLPDLFSATNA